MSQTRGEVLYKQNEILQIAIINFEVVWIQKISNLVLQEFLFNISAFINVVGKYYVISHISWLNFIVYNEIDDSLIDI